MSNAIVSIVALIILATVETYVLYHYGTHRKMQNEIDKLKTENAKIVEAIESLYRYVDHRE